MKINTKDMRYKIKKCCEANPERARIAGAKGGRKTRQGKETNLLFNLQGRKNV